jgi:spore germination protein YaaH
VIDELIGKKTYVWGFMGNARMWQALSQHGDKIGTVGIFSFKVDASGAISEQGVAAPQFDSYRAQWPHIKWNLTVYNDGSTAVFSALRNDQAAQAMFLSELVRILDKYPYANGIDIDLERGGEYENREAANALFSAIYSTVHGYGDGTKQVNICLPAMEGINQSVGGENWCVYADMDSRCDTATIMSYGMAWAGSAPGPVSPRSWLEGVYSYAVKAMDPGKVYMGLPGYGWEWQIYKQPENGDYRGISDTYYGALEWMRGNYPYADSQARIPFAAVWDEYEHLPWIAPYVYDWASGRDYAGFGGPIAVDAYQRRPYATCYSKAQRAQFGAVSVQRNGVPDAINGSADYEYEGVGSDSVTLNGANTGDAMQFYFSGAGDVALQFVFPYFNANEIRVTVDGAAWSYSESRLWWPYWRKSVWMKAATVGAGSHTIEVKGSPQVQFFGYRVCSSFSESPWAGQAEYTLSPRQFLDQSKTPVSPANGFILTAEALRRAPDSALVWYEDFKDGWGTVGQFWTVQSGNWTVWQEGDWEANRPYSQLDGQGRLALSFSAMSDAHVRFRVGFPEGATGAAGVAVGNIQLLFDPEAQLLRLMNGGSQAASWALPTADRHPESVLRTGAGFYTVALRKSGGTIKAYTGPNDTLRFTAQASGAGSGLVSVVANGRALFDLVRVGDGRVYEPSEAFDIVMPDGSRQSFGRIPRTGVTWDAEFAVFSIDDPSVDERATRSEGISTDYDFWHSGVLQLDCPGDHTFTLEPQDINIWNSRLFLGDSDGFCLVWYSDPESIIYWANRAAYDYRLAGFALWSLGQEPLHLWPHLPSLN